MDRARRGQRCHVRQLLRVRRDRTGCRPAAAHARLQRHADRDAQRDLQPSQRRHGAHRRRHRRSIRHQGLDAGVRGHLPDRRGSHRRLSALSCHGCGTAHLRPRRRVDDRGDHGGHRPVVRRAPARAGVWPQPEHRARRIVQRGHVAHLVQAVLRRRVAAAAVAGSGIHGDRSGGGFRLLRARTKRQPPLPPPAGAAIRPVRLERSVAFRSLILVHRRALRRVLRGDLSVSQHFFDQVLPARPRPVAAGRRRHECIRLLRRDLCDAGVRPDRRSVRPPIAR